MLASLLILVVLLPACRNTAEEVTVEPTEEVSSIPTETSEAPVEPSASEAEPESEAPSEAEITTDVGVTAEPCPNPVNADNGCIYLGSISDLTEGPFAALGQSITASQAAFWGKVNAEGGIGGFDIDVATYVRDNKYQPEVHNQVWQEIKPNVLALAQSLGSPQTAAILDDLAANDVVAAPASWTSNWAFQDVILESGVNYCFESMNSMEWAQENLDAPQSVMAVHDPGDYGADAAAGVKIAADALGISFINQETLPAPAGSPDEAIAAIVAQAPDLVMITTGSSDAERIVGETVAQGYAGQFIGTGPAWRPGLQTGAAAAALIERYHVSGPWPTFTSDTPGHQAMREALGPDVPPNDGFTSGWAWSYPLKAALEAAAESGDMTRAGLKAAIASLTAVDYEGMLPEGAGNYADMPAGSVRASVISAISAESPTGLEVVQDFFTSTIAEEYEFTGPCFVEVTL